MQTADHSTSINTTALDSTKAWLICIGKGVNLTPLVDAVTLNYLSGRLVVFKAEAFLIRVHVPFVVMCKLLCEKGRLENRDVLWLSSDPDQTVTSPSTQGKLRCSGTRCSAATAAVPHWKDEPLVIFISISVKMCVFYYNRYNP